MTSPWTISAGAERVELGPTGQAETTFTVTNNGPTDQRAVLDIVSSDAANASWFRVVEPQVAVPHGQSATFVAKIAVPAGTPPGTHWLAGRVYPAETAPEETSKTSDRVVLEVKGTKAPVPWWKKWWWLIAIAGALLVVVLGVVLFLVLGSDDPPPDPTPTPTPTPTPIVFRQDSSVTFTQNQTIDLDEIFVGGPVLARDLQYDPLLPSDGFVTPLNGAQLAKIGATDTPAEACAAAALSSNQVQLSTWKTGEVLCVRTNDGRLSAVVRLVTRRVLGSPPPPPPLQLSITTFES